MSHTVEYDPEENMVIAKVMGKVGLPDLLECIANILRVAKQENCIYILTDLHQAGWPKNRGWRSMISNGSLLLQKARISFNSMKPSPSTAVITQSYSTTWKKPKVG